MLYLFSASISGVAVLWMTNPIWVAKTRMCLQYETISFNDATSTSLKRLTVCRCLGEVWQSEGIRGLYRGILPGMFGVSSGALQFLLYEQFRNQYNGYYQRPIDTHLVRVNQTPFSGIKHNSKSSFYLLESS